MKITLTVNGKQIKATVDEKEMKEAMQEKKEKRTGYECVKNVGYYYYPYTGENRLAHIIDVNDRYDQSRYETADYYSDEEVAKNNARADALMRKLRRFAAEHGGCVAGRRKTLGSGYIIVMPGLELCIRKVWAYGMLVCVAFSTYEAAEKAVETFRDELLWYFTEYDPMPKGWWDD